jgi:peptidyl-tRNA hydrolase
MQGDPRRTAPPPAGDHGSVTSIPGIDARAAAATDLDLLARTVDEWRRRWRDRVVDEDREQADPWSLPLVVRVERTAAPTHAAAVHAAALSVVAVLTRPEAAPASDADDLGEGTGEGPWQAALARWSEGWIRKVVRRARGSRWLEVDELPGVTVSVAGADVRALIPHPVAEPPPALARLQIAGLDLPRSPETADETAATAEPGDDSTVLTIAIAPGLELTTGKACAQVGHAAQLALLQLDRSTVLAWAAAGHPLRVVDATDDDWRRLLAAGAGAVLVHDGGFTEVAPGTLTCAATFDRGR